jgi:hypothetical protein
MQKISKAKMVEKINKAVERGRTEGLVDADDYSPGDIDARAESLLGSTPSLFTKVQVEAGPDRLLIVTWSIEALDEAINGAPAQDDVTSPWYGHSPRPRPRRRSTRPGPPVKAAGELSGPIRGTHVDGPTSRKFGRRKALWCTALYFGASTGQNKRTKNRLRSVTVAADRGRGTRCPKQLPMY